MVESCEACGWAAAILSMLMFGSFGAPIKSDAANSVDIDPLVFQSYKTFMCFVTSWIVLLFGQEFTYTPWGIVSGLFWVPGGVATVYAIRSAGLAIAIGVGSSCIVLVSFIWGIFIFNERVRSKFGACFAVFLMMMGLWGMAYYSSPQKKSMSTISATENASLEEQDGIQILPSSQQKYREVEVNEDDDAPNANNVQDRGQDDTFTDDDQSASRSGIEIDSSDNVTRSRPQSDEVLICGYKISKRKVGIAAAMYNGIWGGSIMVPMQYAGDETKGVGYVISFAIGASIITLLLWVLRYMYHVGRTRSMVNAYRALPSFHVRVMWLAGGLSGTLWSIGNFCSMISVEHLGEGVGYSVSQAGILVSGLWGICYFHEVVGAMTITKWFGSAVVTIVGILFLSFEHHVPDDS